MSRGLNKLDFTRISNAVLAMHKTDRADLKKLMDEKDQEAVKVPRGRKEKKVEVQPKA